jgi:hypothetical protein
VNACQARRVANRECPDCGDGLPAEHVGRRCPFCALHAAIAQRVRCPARGITACSACGNKGHNVRRCPERTA